MRDEPSIYRFTAMLALAVWFICSAAVGLFANALGRSGATWIVFSLLLSPSLGLIVVAVLDKKRVRSARAIEAGVAATATA